MEIIRKWGRGTQGRERRYERSSGSRVGTTAKIRIWRKKMMNAYILPPFDYLEPKSVAQALNLLTKYGDKAKVLAGGTDLLVEMRAGLRAPEVIVSLSSIKGLAYIKSKNGFFRIGATTTLAEIEDSQQVLRQFPVLSEASREIGSLQIRHTGTLGGNLCNAVPSADMAPPLLALDASVSIVGLNGEREMPLERFFTGPHKNALANNELLKEIRFPIRKNPTGAVFIKHAPRRAMEIAIVGVAAAVSAARRSAPAEFVGISLGAVAPTPIRVPKAEKDLTGKVIDSTLAESAGKVAEGESRPISDVRSSADHRQSMVRVLTRRALLGALERIP
jgi:carbon-monoxide dehydrogenase medium subunit